MENSNNVPAYAKVSLEKLRCNNIGFQQPCNNIFLPYQPPSAWVYPHTDEQPYSIPNQPLKFANKMNKNISPATSNSSNSSYRIQPLPSYVPPPSVHMTKCFHHPSTPQYQPPHLRRPVRLTSDSCEQLSQDDLWNSYNSPARSNFHNCFEDTTPGHLADHLMPPPPERFDSSPSGEAVTRFDCEYSADSETCKSLQSLFESNQNIQCSMSQSNCSSYNEKSTAI